MSNQAILVSNLKKSYDGKEVLKDVSFSVPKGIIYALLGSNGAGKTTTIRILTTQIPADGGKLQIEGYSVSECPQKVRQIISLTGQFSAVDESLTGKENLILMGQLRHLSDPAKHACRLLEYFSLSSCGNQKVSSYSGGMKRKLDIAMSLIGHPKVIFLDEPTTGLDPQSRHNMWDLIKTLRASGVTIFLTTQYLEEAETLADTVAILHNGSIIAEGTPRELKSYLPHGALEIFFQDQKNLSTALSLFKDYKTSISSEEYKLTVFTDGKGDTLTEICSRLFQNNIKIQEISQLTPKLEDVFLSMIHEKEV